MFDFSKFSDVGDYLSLKNCEENNRSAISRYYYSVFGSVRMYLVLFLNEFEFIDNFRVHSRICDRMGNSDDNTESEIGEILDDLREIRNYADYEWDKFDEDYFKKNLVKVRNNSKLALDEVESLKKSPPFKF